MQLKILILTSFLFLGLLSLPTVIAGAEDATANATIDITISATAVITLNDTDVNFGTVAPMANSTQFGMLVTNTGSKDISNIYAWADTLKHNSTNPRGTSTSSNWIATSFLSLDNNTAGDDWYYVGNLVWNMSTNYDNTTWTLSGEVNAFGDFWEGGSETTDLYYWEMTNGTSASSEGAYCNQSDTSIKIQTTKNDKDTSSGTALTADTQSTDWATWKVGSGPWLNYCIASDVTCKYLYIYKWDYNSTYPACQNRNYTTGAQTLSPAETYTFRIKAIVPPNVADGATTQGMLKIYGASS